MERYVKETSKFYKTEMIPKTKVKFTPKFCIADRVGLGKITGILTGNTDWPCGTCLFPKYEWKNYLYPKDNRRFDTYGSLIARHHIIEDITQDNKYGKYVEQRRATAEALFGKLHAPPLLKSFLQYPVIGRLLIFTGIFHSKSHITTDGMTCTLFVVHKIANEMASTPIKKEIKGLLNQLDNQKNYISQGKLATTASGLFKLTYRYFETFNL